MSRPRFKPRELLFIGVPVAAVIIGAAFFTRQQTIREQDRSGPYRAEITRVEILPVSPFEAWQGFDTKIIVHLSELGQFKQPPGINISPHGGFGQNVILVGRVNGQEKSFPVTSQDYGNGFEPENSGVLRALMMPRSEELKNTITFLAATSRFDPDSPLQLRGEIWGEVGTTSNTQITSLPPGWTSENIGGYWHLRVRSKSAALTQPLEQKANVGVDRTTPPVENVEVELLSPVYAHTGVIGDNGSAIVQINFKPGSFPNTLPLLTSTAAQILDAQGRVVPIKDSIGFNADKTVGWDMNSSPPSTVVRLPIESVPLERGALKMRVWFAVKDGWPIKIETEVRPAWMSQRPRTLQLQNVSVQGSNVFVTAHYTGQSSLKYQSQIDYRGQGKPLYFDERDDPIVGFLPNVNYKRLFTYWSQHYTLTNGKSYWFPNAVSVQSVDCDATNHCHIIYKTNALSALKPGQSARFFAQIGVQGDGFLPIRATITRPKQ